MDKKSKFTETNTDSNKLSIQLTDGLGCDVYIEATGAGGSVK